MIRAVVVQPFRCKGRVRSPAAATTTTDEVIVVGDVFVGDEI
jgi:hypothetical protein